MGKIEIRRYKDGDEKEFRSQAVALSYAGAYRGGV